MKIALIYPKIRRSREFRFGIGGYDEIMAGYPPLSLAYVAGIIRRAGHEALIVDANITNLRFSDVVEKVRHFSPDALGFTVTTSTFHDIVDYAGRLKKEIGVPVIAGGALAGLFPAEIMRWGSVDYAVIGSGARSLARLLEGIARGDVSDVPDIASRREGAVVINPGRGESGIDELPFPARELLPNDKYYSPFCMRRNFTAMITSKGCRFSCPYCCLSEPLRFRPVDGVVEEISECRRRFGIRHIDMYDAVFTADKPRTIGLCGKIRQRNLGLTWSARTRIDSVDEELLGEMASSGCRLIMYGIESTDPGRAKALGREPIPVKRLREIIAMTRRKGIKTLGFFMLGAPGETAATLAATIADSRRLGLDFAQFSRLTVIPGTAFYRRFLEEHGRDFWREYIKTGDMRGFPEVGVDVDRGVISKSVNQANIRFYARLPHLARLFLTAGSTEMFLNYLRAGARVASGCLWGER